MTIHKFYLTALLFAAFFVIAPIEASAKDEWLQVRSKNFYLIGNASEKEIRKAATKLEQFRESFRLIFGEAGLTASIPTNVVVFKSDSSYKPFKPKRGDGKIDNFIAGYFQPGEDVNYITLSTEGTESDTYGTIFHEYVHFILNTSFGKSEVPPWFNEGLAEYYQTFEIDKDQEIRLGKHQDVHVLNLRQNQLIPLKDFFEVGNRSLGEHGDHARNVFYSQAWALIHYLTFKGKGSELKKFLGLRMNGRPAEASFRETFGIGYPEMEKELRKYVGQGAFNYMVFPLKAKLVFDADMQVSPLTEAESNAYLGDLLYRIDRSDDAEPFLRNALAQQQNLSMANATLGMIKIRQRKFDEAKGFLEKAISQNDKNYLALYRYAYLISREGRDEFGYVNKFDAVAATKMRDLLKKAIAVNPGFTESHELLAFVNLVNNEELDDAVKYLQQAMKSQPGNSKYAMRIAEIYIRQDKFTEAAAIADKIAKTSDDEELRARATSLASEIRQRQQMTADYDARRKEFERGRAAASGTGVGEPILVRRKPGEDIPNEEQMRAAHLAAMLRGINQSLRAVGAGEERVIGQITKIECGRAGVVYSVKTADQTFTLTSKDFQSLTITAFVDEGIGEIGCDYKPGPDKIVVTYKPVSGSKPSVRGELLAIEFVPAIFKFVDLATEAKSPTYVVEETGPLPTEGEFAEERRKAMLEGIRSMLRPAGAGERREMGFIERSECTNKGIFFHIKFGDQILRLSRTSPETMMMRAFTPDVENLQLGCGMKQVDVPVVFIYREATDTEAKTAGELISLEFVPKSFTLK